MNIQQDIHNIVVPFEYTREDDYTACFFDESEAQSELLHITLAERAIQRGTNEKIQKLHN